MHASTKLESKLFIVAIIFLMACFGLTVFAVHEFGLDVPTCVTSIEPFNQGAVIERSPNHYEIHYVAKMWAFEPADVQVRPGSTLDIYLSSVDVTHGFQIAGTNVNLMAVPGTVNYAQAKFDKVGRYRIVCHEYCGSGHHNMITYITVTDNPILTPPTQGPIALGGTKPESPEAVEAMKIMQTKGCVGCHTTDGKPGVGPTFKGLFGKTEQLEDGTSVTVDEAYLKESITQPKAKIVKGFQPLMPEIPLSNDELKDLIRYIKSLK